jgi:regulator of PEP synthase PpsR (kinase-PPPase family)
MDEEYFSRIEAMQFALAHDDGQSTWDLEEADVVLLGVSRTSKTPTSIYLANRGIKTANIPIVPGCPIPKEVFEVTSPLVIGLTKDPKRLVEIRRQRLKLLDQDENTDYVNLETVSREINDARRLYAKNDWPVINVSRKSIEETAATVIQMYHENKELNH